MTYKTVQKETSLNFGKHTERGAVLLQRLVEYETRAGTPLTDGKLIVKKLGQLGGTHVAWRSPIATPQTQPAAAASAASAASDAVAPQPPFIRRGLRSRGNQ